MRGSVVQQTPVSLCCSTGDRFSSESSVRRHRSGSRAVIQPVPSRTAFPRPQLTRVQQAVRMQAQGSTQQLKRVQLKTQPATPEAFAPFGQVISANDDGKSFDMEDAQLVLDRGTPRFYLMRLQKRGMSFDRITFHADVTQCLGAVGDAPWYLAVAAPTGSVDRSPAPQDITAFRVPPGSFLKLHMGTWHAGPLFDAEQIDFYNLELADTNVVDHNTHHYAEQDGLVLELVDELS